MKATLLISIAIALSACDVRIESTSIQKTERPEYELATDQAYGLVASSPFYQFTARLGLPLVPSGMGFGTGAHAPNEIMLIEPAEGVAAAGLAEIEKAYVDFVYALAKAE